MPTETEVALLAAVIAAVVAFLVAGYRVHQDRKNRRSEWLKERIAHLNSVIRTLNRFESRMISKKSDVDAYLDKDITLAEIGGMTLRYPEQVFASDTDKCIFEERDETEVSEQINELGDLLDELEDLNAQFLKDGENPKADALSTHLADLVACSTELNRMIEEVRDRMKLRLKLLG